MMQQQLIGLRELPSHVVRALEFAERVRVIDGQYHRVGSNINGPDPMHPNARPGVIGFRMRCGVETYPPFYAQFEGRMLAREAHQRAEPCPRCFPEDLR